MPVAISDILCPSGFSVSPIGTIQPWTTVPLNVTFSPTNMGSYSGTISIISNATNSPSKIPVSGSAVALFSDDFSDDYIDPIKWIATGNSVNEINHQMQVSTTVTDAGGNVASVPVPIFGKGLITISRDAFIHPAYMDWGVYHAFFSIKIGNLPTFAIWYDKFSFYGYPDSTSYGFFISRNNASPLESSQLGDVSSVISPIFNSWFNEMITYDSLTGDMEYFINGLSQAKYYVGVLPQSSNPTISVSCNSWGWFTGHEQDFQNFSITQNSFGNTLQVSGTNGSININPNQAIYSPGTQVVLTPLPNSGYQFVGWIGDIIATSNPLIFSINNNTSLIAKFTPNAYMQWKITNFGANATNDNIAGDFSSPSGDCIPNLLKYAFNLDPSVPSPDHAPSVKIQHDSNSNHKYFNFTYPHRIGSTDLSYIVSVSDDLQTWDDSGAQLDQVSDPVPANDGIMEWVTLRLQTPIDDPGTKKKFLRLKVIRLY